MKAHSKKTTKQWAKIQHK